MTKVTSQGTVAVGVDNHERLWVWGEHFAKDDSEVTAVLYADYTNNRCKPFMVKYFMDNNLKVLDCSSGYYNALVKVKNA